MSRKDMKIVYQFLDGTTGRRSDSMCSTVGELAALILADYQKNVDDLVTARVAFEADATEENQQAFEEAERRANNHQTQYVLVLTEGEETEVDRVSRCPLITFESFVRINDFVE